MTLRPTIVLLSVLLATSARAAPHSYALPEETAELAPGPNLETVQGNCGACHSSEYISTQPRTFADPRAFWTAEVAKMQQVNGAPVAHSDVPAIVDYLVATYGK